MTKNKKYEYAIRYNEGEKPEIAYVLYQKEHHVIKLYGVWTDPKLMNYARRKMQVVDRKKPTCLIIPLNKLAELGSVLR